MKGVLLALLSALLLTLSFPRLDLQFLAWVALVPLLLALHGNSPLAAFCLSFITGVGFFIGISYWTLVVDAVDLVHFLPVEAYLGLNIAIFGLVFSLSKTHCPLLTTPLTWVSIEYVRSHAGFLECPWALLGYSQYQNLHLIQFASITGAYGVSFLIVMVNAALCEIVLSLKNRKQSQHHSYWQLFKPMVTPISLLAVALLYGHTVIAEPASTKTFAVSVIQPNIPQVVRWEPRLRELHLQKHVSLSKQVAANGHAPLIVWPETSVQGSLAQDRLLMSIFSNLAQETRSHLLVGVSVRPKFGSKDFKVKNRHNSAQLISPDGSIVGQYNKIKLLPFAEYLPHKGTIPWSKNLTSLAGDFMWGTEYNVLAVSGVKFGVTICWETIFPDLFRQLVKNGANFMVNITNEAWFKETAGPYHFIPMTVFRAVENRISIARSANTGISGFIDPYGRVMGKVKSGSKDIFVEGYLTMKIPLSRTRTFYTMHGDMFAYLVLLGTAAFIIAGLRRSKIQ